MKVTDPIVDRWRKMEQDEFERLKRENVREDLQAAFDAEKKRRDEAGRLTGSVDAPLPSDANLMKAQLARIPLWYFSVLYKYFSFQGRASRAEFWSFILIDSLVVFILFRLSGGWASMMDHLAYSNSLYWPQEGWGLWMGLYQACTLLPFLAVMVRRLHDTNRSGWRFFMMLIPIVGPIMLLVYLCQDRRPLADESYGSTPRQPEVTFFSLRDYLWLQVRLCGRILVRPYRAFNEVSTRTPDLLSLIVIGAAYQNFGRHIAWQYFRLHGDTEGMLFFVGILIGLVGLSWLLSLAATRCCGKVSLTRAFNIIALACLPLVVIRVTLQNVLRFLHLHLGWFEHPGYGGDMPWLHMVITCLFGSCLFGYTLVLALYGLFAVRHQPEPSTDGPQKSPHRNEYQSVIENPLSLFVMTIICTTVYFSLLTMLLRLLRVGAMPPTLLIPVSTVLGAITAYRLWGNLKQENKPHDTQV